MLKVVFLLNIKQQKQGVMVIKQLFIFEKYIKKGGSSV